MQGQNTVLVCVTALSLHREVTRLQQQWVPLSAGSQAAALYRGLCAKRDCHAQLRDPALTELRMPGSSLKRQ